MSDWMIDMLYARLLEARRINTLRRGLKTIHRWEVDVMVMV